MKITKILACVLSAGAMLTSCTSPFEKNDTSDDSIYAENMSSARETEAEAVTSAKPLTLPEATKKKPEELDIGTIPVIPDVEAGQPDDGSFPYVVGEEEGFDDENGVHHYSCDELCHSFYDTIMKYNSVVELNGVFEDEDFQKASRLVFDMNPDVFWIKDVSYDIRANGTSRVEFGINDGVEMEKVPQMHEELLAKTDEIVKLAKKQPTDYEKILFVHDYLIDNTTYDIESLNTYKNYAYGSLIEGACACNGYSKAFQLLMQKLGFTCGIFSGYVDDNDHMWNYLWFNDDYYWVDLTWDDPSSSEHEMRRYSYFMCTDDIMMEHRTGKSYVLYTPECDHETYSYAYMNDLVLDSYDFDLVDSLVCASTETHIDLLFTNDEEYKKALEDLYDNANIRSLYIWGPEMNSYFFMSEDDRRISIDWWAS